MLNINFNFGTPAGYNGGGMPGLGGGMPSVSGGMPGFGGGMPGFSGGMPGFGGSCPCAASAGFGADSMQQMLMSTMNMMSMAMMMLMSQMMGQQVGLPGQMPFGGGLGAAMGGGNPNGSPLGGFLGGNSLPGAAGGNSGGASGANATGNTSDAPAGKIGNLDVDKMINSIDSGYRPYARKSWPAIIKEAQKQGITNKAQLAYILATTVHESGAGKYMQEIASGSAYEGRRDLGNNQAGDGVRFKGRGYVQITGRNNYTNWGKKLGLDLVGNPSLAERPEIAAQILVRGMKEGSFTGKGLNDYINGSKTDFEGARRIVNGTDKAGTFANTARKILASMG